jgi:Pectate lyase superfamily protein
MRTRSFLIALLLSFGFCVAATAADRINVTEPPYGAIPNDGGDDTNAINAAMWSGQSIYFPPGTYNYTGSVVIPANTSYRFYGDGPGVSTIIFTGNPYTGFYGYNMGSATLEIDGLTLKANSKYCGTGIYAVFNQAGATDKVRTATIHNVQIIGSTRDGATGSFWNGGIYLERAQDAVIENVEIIGNARNSHTYDGGWDSGTDFGIKWVSSDSYKTTGLQLSNLMVWYCNTALQTYGAVEGLYLDGFEFAFCGNYGVPVVDLNSSNANMGSSFHLVNGHVGAMQNGMRLTNLRGAKVSQVHFIHVSGTQFASTGDDLALYSCNDVVISDNSFVGVDSSSYYPSETGIYVYNSGAVQIEGNYITHYFAQHTNDAFIKIASNSLLVRIVNNVFAGGAPEYGGVNRAYDDAAPNTYYWGNNL